MSEFKAPKGMNFSCLEELPAAELSKVLRQTANFIQRLEPYEKLKKYEDWWEYDGLHFYRKSICIEQLFNIVSSPKSLFEAMPGDDLVFIGIAPKNHIWYLRFYLDRDEKEENPLGCFDITLPDSITENFEKEILDKLDIKMKKQEAEKYYQSIIL